MTSLRDPCLNARDTTPKIGGHKPAGTGSNWQQEAPRHLLVPRTTAASGRVTIGSGALNGEGHGGMNQGGSVALHKGGSQDPHGHGSGAHMYMGT